MTHITITTPETYESKLEQAKNDTNTSKEAIENTVFTPSQIHGKAVMTPRLINSIGRVTEVDLKDGRVTVNELFTGSRNTYTRTADECADQDGTDLTLTLPEVGAQHTVTWIEAKTGEGHDGWERVSDRVIQDETMLTDVKRKYDTTRRVERRYIHNPHGYKRIPITANQNEIQIHDQKTKFHPESRLSNILVQINPPAGAGEGYVEVGSIYVERQADSDEKKLAIRAVSVDELVADGSSVDVGIPDYKQAAFKLGGV